MAVNSTQYALYAAPTLKIPSREQYSVERTFYAEYDASALLGGGANGCINMIVIPAGGRLVDGRLEWAALGSGTLLFVGDQYVCGRFMTRADGSVASVNQRNQTTTIGIQNCGRFNGNTTGPSEQSLGYLFTCDTTVIVSNLSGSATGRIQLFMTVAYGA